MKKLSLLSAGLAATFVLFLQAAPAQAQIRTWVSGVGDDANPCSRTAPCKTLASALSKTTAGGEISVLDGDSLGSVTITKAITINGEGTLGSILASGGTGITVSAAASDRVTIRNLSINGAGGGTTGIYITSGQVTIDKCFIYGFTAGFLGGSGINVAASNNTWVAVRDTNITNVTYGVLMQASSGFAAGSLDNVRINDAPGYGVATLSNNAFISINRSVIMNVGVYAILTSNGNGQINVDNSELTNSGTAVNAASSGSTIRLNNNSIYNNTTDFAIGAGATIATANNNKTAANGAGAVPNGVIGNQ